MPETQIELTSGDETDIMPPPPPLPQRSRPVNKKGSESISSSNRSASISSGEKTVLKIKREGKSSLTETARPKRTQNKKKPVASDSVDIAATSAQTTVVDETQPENKSKNTTVESVYEDARDDPLKIEPKSFSISVLKLDFVNSVLEANRTQNELYPVGDSTFVMPAQSKFFTPPTGNDTFVMPNKPALNSSTPPVSQPLNNETIVIESNVSHSSLITEDNSEDDQESGACAMPPPSKKVASSRLPAAVNTKKKNNLIFE